MCDNIDFTADSLYRYVLEKEYDNNFPHSSNYELFSDEITSNKINKSNKTINYFYISILVVCIFIIYYIFNIKK